MKTNTNQTNIEDDDNLTAQYQRMTLLSHIKTLPDTYIGSVENEETEQYVVDRDVEADLDGTMPPTNFIRKKFKCIPGLKSIIEEIIINAYDNKNRVEQKIRDNGKKLKRVTYIKFYIDRNSNTISIENNGEGIDVAKHPTEKGEHGKDLWIPELIFGELLTSGNYDKTIKKTTGGKNGYGAKLTSVFSTEFTIETCDYKRKLNFKQTHYNNMDTKTDPVITKYIGEPYTRITFKPDLEKFKLEKIHVDMEALLEKRAYDLYFCSNGELEIIFNNKKIEFNNINDYFKLYLNHSFNKLYKDATFYNKAENTSTNYTIEDEIEIPKEMTIATFKNKNGWIIGAAPNPNLMYEQVSFVNGINTLRGGRHVDYIVKQITSKLITMIQKKHRVIVKDHYIKENLIVFVNAIIVNPSFDSQTKTTLTTNIKEFGFTCDIPDSFINKLYDSSIIDRVLELNSLKSEQCLKKSDGRKTKKIDVEKLEDAVWAGTKRARDTILILTEGDSAKTMAMNGRSVIGNGHQIIGIYPLRGKLVNTREKTINDYNNNKEICDLKKILGLQENEIYNDTTKMRYGKIMIMTDQDHDGTHIKGLIMNFLSRWPSLMMIKDFICSFLTPIIKVWKGTNKTKSTNFYTMTDYENWVSSNDTKGYKHKYYKGLGTSTPQEAKQYFLDFKVVYYHWDEESFENMDKAFNKSRANDRKIWLADYDRDRILDINQTNVTYSDFINLELIHFSNSDNQRSLPSAIDGLKVSQRKILFCCLKRNLKNEIRVSQLAGYVSENAGYHHGEASLLGTIVNMAQNYVGSNNINYLHPEGQFGTRMCGGKDSAQPRYIHTFLENITNVIYNEKDSKILKYNNDDGHIVEPEHYLPIIPMALVNSPEGIGTGWSNYIPSFNPIDLANNIIRKIKGGEIKEMNPYYRGFRGQIIKVGNNKWISKGTYVQTSINTIVVNELPIGVWTDNFKIMLDSYMYNHSNTNTGNKKNVKRASNATEKNKTLYVKDYVNESSDTTIKFTITFLDDVLDTMLLKKVTDYANLFEKKFKLVSNISCANTLNCYDENNILKSFVNCEAILNHFYHYRLKRYDDRKNYILDKLNNSLKLLSVKSKFISEIISGDLIINNKPKKEIINSLKNKQYPKMLNNKLVTFSELENLDNKNDANYDFLIKMPIYNLTKEKYDELLNDISKLEEEIKELECKSDKDLWLEDLMCFKSEYANYLKTYYKYMGIDPKDFNSNSNSNSNSQTKMNLISRKKSGAKDGNYKTINLRKKNTTEKKKKVDTETPD